MVRCEMCETAMSVYVKSGARCGMLQFQTWWDVVWYGVECGVLVCGMLHNARCGKLQCDVKCGGVELW